MGTPRIRSLAAAAAAAAALAPAPVRAQACTNGAAFGLYASSYMDSQLNPPPGEDVEFFSSSGGVPTVYFLLDNSGSMRRLPPNGPGFYTGRLPPLNDINCPAGGDEYDPDCASPTGPRKRWPVWPHSAAPPGVIGCGLDPVSAVHAGGGTAIGDILNRNFAPMCGKALNAGVYMGNYDPARDYAHEASPCPHYKNPTPSGGDDGYDPDFYCGSTGAKTACSSKPNLFDKLMVFHESITDGSDYPNGASGTSAWGFNATDGGTFDPAKPPGNGWNDITVFPYKKASSTYGTVADFCTQYATDMATTGVTTQGALPVESICKTCLTQRGFFFDGYAYRRSQEGLNNVLYASIWLTGNYLNFYPPKFVVARKALKDLLMNNLRMRSGIATFGSGGGSACSTAAASIQPLNPACNNVYDSVANLYSNRSSFMSAINAVRFGTGTPLGEALLNVGQQFRTPGTPWFDGSCTNTAFEPSGGSANQQGYCFPCQNTSIVVVTDGRPKPTDDTTFPAGTASSAQAAAACTATVTTGCLGSSATGVVSGPDATSCPQCQGTTAAGGPGGASPFGPSTLDINGNSKEYLNDAIRVAWLLHSFDARRDTETAYACNLFAGKQTLNVYTLGFGASFNADATQLLGAMAHAGGGIYVGAENGQQLGEAFKSILLTIDTRATSFSVASVNALQATAGQSVIVPRFNPSKAAFWNGHLYRFELFSEFAASGANACKPGGTGDLDCDCTCTSVFLQDAEGSFISEDSTGAFKKNKPNLPTCGLTNHCSSCGKADPDPTKLAVSYWDAADRLLSRSWKSRAIYTVIDDPSAPDGRIDSGDPLVPLIDPAAQTFDDADVTHLLPYLGLSLTGGGTCDLLGAQMAAAGDSVGAAAVNRDLALCAKAFLAYLLGADVLNQDLNSSTSACPYPPPSPGTDSSGNAIWDPLALCDRGPPNAPGKLGDIFHSSPVRVLEPEPSSSLFSAYNNQTLASLWLTSTKEAVASGSPNGHAYDDYSDKYHTRRRLVVVGANDGLLHAFDGGNWQAGKDDPALLPAVKTSQPPMNGYYDKGTGDELWAFLPPDLISKVPLMLGSQHQFFVDGDPMVRDVWVDGGTPNTEWGGTASADDLKQPNEFHTVMIAAERRGGTHYFALDVTDATRAHGEAGFEPPRFLWVYPQPTDPEQLEFGATYTGFLPVAPPIGPVRLDASTVAPEPSADTQTYLGVKVHERWVVFLPGGFDPQYVRGHGVHLLDVWTGRELFDFSRPPTGAAVPADDPRWKLDAPVASTVGMVAFGPEARGDLAYPPNGAFFDTATFGDANGAIWTLRFNTPGAVGAGGKVTNWFGARSFQFARSTSSGLCAGRQPFFYIAANVPLYSSNRSYRVLAGTGDRFNLLDQYGGTCGPDNIRACVLRGCSVSVPQANNRITVDDLLGTQSMGFSTTNLCGVGAETSASGSAGASCNAIQGRAEVDITGCSGMDVAAMTATSKTYGVDCAPTADGGATCSRSASVTQSAGEPLVQSTALNYKNWFVSVRNFADTGARAPFKTLAEAAAYDAARLTETDLVQIDGASASPTVASADGDGWALYFNHSGTFTDPVSSKVYNITPADERTASPSSTPGDSCIYWNTVQTTLNPKSAQCPCTFQNTDRIMYFYGANIASGGLCLQKSTIAGSGTACTVSGTSVRSVSGTTLTTPPAPQPTYFVNASGQVSVGMVSIQVGSGAQNINTGLIEDAVRPVEWLPVPRSLEPCRHAGQETPPASAAACQP